ESRAAALDRLARQAARQDDPAATVAMAEELLAFAAVLCREVPLRRALADSGRDASGKIELLRSLVSARVRPETLDMLATLVSGRWAKASELLSATERLGIEALLVAAAHAGDLAEIEDELFRFGQIVAGDPRLAAVLGDPTAGSRREGLVQDLLEGKVRPLTLRLGLLALAGLGGRSFGGSVTWMVEAAARRRERMVAYVTTAVPLSAAEEQHLKRALSARCGGKLSLKVTIDAAVLGGVRVQVGAEVFDGTAQRMLIRARQTMTR
ncbi:MAG: F0F1 ATP synthase subunit delta, partial [Micromonosporaceae bacterium]|nr:F0F1 ATP synthase subunit delta [Micromonosporaceae bacterium]